MIKVQPTHYEIGWRLAQEASEGVALEVSLFLDGDAYRKFVGRIIEEAISAGEQRGATQSYLAGIRDGADAAFNKRFDAVDRRELL